MLRAFRDRVLLQTEAGSRLVAFYYRHGPTWAMAAGRDPELGGYARSGLDVAVAVLEGIDLGDPCVRAGLDAVVIVTDAILLGPHGEGASAPAVQELTFLNWADYMDPAVLEEFHERTGIRVKEVYFDTDETRDQMLLATEGRGYDLAIVNGGSLRLLAKRGWLEPVSEADLTSL